MLEAVHTIHEHRIVHSDLKPANFLFCAGVLKLIDFGIAKAISNDTTNIVRDSQVKKNTPRADTECTTPSLIPTVNGNSVRSFSTHGQQSAAKGSLTTVSRSDIRLIQHLDSSAL